MDLARRCIRGPGPLAGPDRRVLPHQRPDATAARIPTPEAQAQTRSPYRSRWARREQVSAVAELPRGDMGSCSATKGRFTAYFHVEDNGDGWEREEDEAAKEVEAVREKQTPSMWVWERRGAKLRTSGDLEWYRHVDLTALDGSVGRLWDLNGGLRRRM